MSPWTLRLVYQTWKNGDDLKQIMTKPTFYRVRKQLLAFGIDIAVVNEKNNIIPLIRYLEAEPVGIPDWAYEKNLVAWWGFFSPAELSRISSEWGWAERQTDTTRETADKAAG